MLPWNDARDAIKDANSIASMTGLARAVGYIQGEGWIHYNPVDGAPDGTRPEFLCFALGQMPMPLNEGAWDVLNSAIRAGMRI